MTPGTWHMPPDTSGTSDSGMTGLTPWLTSDIGLTHHRHNWLHNSNQGSTTLYTSDTSVLKEYK